MAELGCKTRSVLAPETDFHLLICSFVIFLAIECLLQTRHRARHFDTHDILSCSQQHEEVNLVIVPTLKIEIAAQRGSVFHPGTHSEEEAQAPSEPGSLYPEERRASAPA